MVGPYLWKTYDLLVLPSFPFGGMENPNLTFVTPELIVSSLFCLKTKNYTTRKSEVSNEAIQ